MRANPFRRCTASEKLIKKSIPYVLFGYVGNLLSHAYRLSNAKDSIGKLSAMGTSIFVHAPKGKIEMAQKSHNDKDFYLGLLLFAISISSLALHISISGLKELDMLGIIVVVFNVILMVVGVGMAALQKSMRYKIK